MTLTARVSKGRLVLDEPTDLPEGTEVDFYPWTRGTGVMTKIAQPRTVPSTRRRPMWLPVGWSKPTIS
jgi:hypothetical protein